MSMFMVIQNIIKYTANGFLGVGTSVMRIINNKSLCQFRIYYLRKSCS
jgi:hypothetical protein